MTKWSNGHFFQYVPAESDNVFENISIDFIRFIGSDKNFEDADYTLFETLKTKLLPILSIFRESYLKLHPDNFQQKVNFTPSRVQNIRTYIRFKSFYRRNIVILFKSMGSFKKHICQMDRIYPCLLCSIKRNHNDACKFIVYTVIKCSVASTNWHFEIISLICLNKHRHFCPNLFILKANLPYDF